MIPRRSPRRPAAASLLASLVVLFVVSACGRPSGLDEELERAYRANNRGVAFLEQFDYEQAAGAFRTALEADASLPIVHVNLSLALLYSQDVEGALAAATEAARLLPDAPQPHYVLGLVARARNSTDEAIGAFERVRAIDALDVGTSVNLGQVYMEQRRYDEAIGLLRAAASAEPYNVTAAYNLGLALTRNGQADEGRVFLDRAQSLRDTGYAVTYGTGYLEQGRYAEAMASTGAEAGLVDEDVPSAGFDVSEVTSSPQATQGGRGACLALVDADGSGTLSLFHATPTAHRFYRNNGQGEFVDVTGEAGLGPGGAGPVACVSGDLDGDGRGDLLVARPGAVSLYRAGDSGTFQDVTQASGIAPLNAVPGALALTDLDHDGDLDIVIAASGQLPSGGASDALSPASLLPGPLVLWRNNGNGTFADITAAAGLADVRAHAVAIVPTDFDNRRDVDLLIVSATSAPLLFQNQRNGTFREVAADVGLAGAAGGGAAVVAAGDINHDGFTDFFFGRESGPTFVLSDGRGRFTASAAPAAANASRAAHFVDYDRDGLLDLVTWTDSGPRVLRNVGTRWEDVTADALSGSGPVPSSARGLAVADLNGDGRTDLLTGGDSGIAQWRGTGDGGRAVTIALAGRVSNRGGVGSRIEVRAGSLRAHVERSAASPAVTPSDIVVGIGDRDGADVVRVLWPSGILQAEAGEGPLAQQLRVEELDRKPSSCPFLFVWNGERFEFVTDFLGAGEMGYWLAPGLRNTPDPIEYVRIPGDRLRARDGRFDLRITNELEEVVFLDRVQLLAIDHPADTEVYPDEGMTAVPKPFRVVSVRDARVPRAYDDEGRDVTERIAAIDRRYADGFSVEPIRGYASLHGLRLELDSPGSGLVLLLTGWTDYAFSSDNVAAHQAGLTLVPPRLEARSGDGPWRTVVEDVGVPVGRPQTVTVDLSGRLRPEERELRIVTSMRIYWDRVQVAQVDSGLQAPRPLNPVAAILRARGYSAEVRPDGQNPPLYDFARVTQASPWKALVGRYTREGDVAELITAADDMFVIARSGDELALSFDATDLAPLREGWTRTFLMMADGYSKEMDINSASPDAVEPLPFHTMTAYPYPASEKYPETPAHQEYQARYNTRSVSKPAPSIDLAMLAVQ